MPAAAAEDQKRLANRIAQRKFRRQRKDYIAQLERELAICKAGADAELLQRRKDVEKLRSERAELRSLLDHVVKNLQRICGEDNDDDVVSDTPEIPDRKPTQDGSSSPTASGLDPTSKQQQDSPLSSSPGVGTSSHKSPETIADAPMIVEQDKGNMLAQNSHNALASSRVRQELMNPSVYERGVGVPCTPNQHLSNISGFLPPQEPLLWLVSQDISCDTQTARASSQITHQLEPSGVQFGAAPGFGNTCTQLSIMDLDNQAHPSSLSNIHGHIEEHNLLLNPPTTEGEESSDGNEGNHFSRMSSWVFGDEHQRGVSRIKLRRVEMISMLSQRRTEALAESCIAEYELHGTTLQALNEQLNQGLVEIMSLAFSSYLKTTRNPIRMYGGFWWVVWHILKSKIIIPRLISRGIIDADADFDESLDVLRSNTPLWLRPTEVQRSVLHHFYIDMIPWPEVRDRFILQNDDIPSFDYVLTDMSRRWLPTGVSEDDEFIGAHHAPNIQRRFQTYQERASLDSFYSCIGIWKLQKGSGDSLSLGVDRLAHEYVASF